MKKLIIYIVVALVALPATSYAQKTTAELLKIHKKEINGKKKEYEKGGWQLFGTSRTIEVALAKFYEKLDNMGNDGQEIVGVAARCQSKNVAHQMAFTSAVNQVAQMNDGKLMATLESRLASDSKDVANEIDNFMAAYGRKVQATIAGELEEAYSIIREIEPGVYEMQSFYVYNKRSASEARIRAIKSTALENSATQKYAEELENALKGVM